MDKVGLRIIADAAPPFGKGRDMKIGELPARDSDVDRHPLHVEAFGCNTGMLVFGPQHGQGIARTIQQQSENVLIVDHGSLYPALQRLEERGFISAEWGTSDNNRKARFYALTRKGRKELTREEGAWRRVAAAIGRVLDTEPRKA